METMHDTDTKFLSKLGIASPNEMQKNARKAIIDKNDILLLAPTGTGKTLAYLLPLYDLIDKNIKEVQCIIIVPARELAIQIGQVWKKMGTGLKVNVCYGGHPLETEINNLSVPPELLIGTPGRLKDHLERKSFTAGNINILILDEFDKSLQLGFQEDMQAILGQLPKISKRILLSATAEINIPDFTGIGQPYTLDYTKEKSDSQLSIKIVTSPEKDKIETLVKLIGSFHSEPAIIFCNHRESAERISGLLNKNGITCGFYHGGMEQVDRERILIRFRNHSLNYLATTDLASRGLDIPDMRHVIHYHLPSDYTEFIHRNGRTARMQQSGTAYILIWENEQLPDYLPSNMETFIFPTEIMLPDSPEYQTIYISGGKKNKINKVDIVGMFIQKGGIDKNDIGLIEIKDFMSYAAVKKNKVKKLLATISNEKIKGKKYKIEIARE